ncbi:MAG: 5-(carboxyamino)imidazole ribonucleotide synthase [Halioglobus sp.]|nr:5-(carboxyamino)imidazole ribonucleotide synthase [Halioglobus sp.]
MARLGIVGSGQLALYLTEAAHTLGVEVAVLSQPGDAPALAIADRAFVAAADDVAVAEEFLASCDVVTFDKEDIPEAVLGKILESEQRGDCVVRPGVAVLRLLKDKACQKQWLVNNGLPTLPYRVLTGAVDSVDSLTREFGDAVVQKSRSGGYDGRGVQILAPLETAGQLWDTGSIVEPYLPGAHEVAVIVGRAASGAMEVFPPVSMEFDSSLNAVHTVVMPAILAPELCSQAQALARTAIEKLDGVGVFAVEMFVTAAGELLINEISPRVHNSGHITLDACNVSQFEQHVRAVVGLPLVPVCLEQPGVMLNILEEAETPLRYPAAPVVKALPDSGAKAYWYGKTPGRPGRKMGHINAVGPTLAEATEHARAALVRLGNNDMGAAA